MVKGDWRIFCGANRSTAFAIVSIHVFAAWTDRIRVRWPVRIYMASFNSILNVFSCGAVPWCLNSSHILVLMRDRQPTFAWENHICADDDQERASAVVLASMKYYLSIIYTDTENSMCNNIINDWYAMYMRSYARYNSVGLLSGTLGMAFSR
ncbi:hypothetical protein BYT27DRAFT_7249650 [Phlegmacium glaucopus]|nr:hypothetical protein BYT27DRAFT_7249650 [Phlegmacium glaucopus]